MLRLVLQVHREVPSRDVPGVVPVYGHRPEAGLTRRGGRPRIVLGWPGPTSHRLLGGRGRRPVVPWALTEPSPVEMFPVLSRPSATARFPDAITCLPLVRVSPLPVASRAA